MEGLYIKNTAILVIKTMQEPARKIFASRLNQEKHGWEIGNKLRYPRSDSHKALKHFYAYRFLNSLLEEGGLVNIDQLQASVANVAGGEFDNETFYMVCQNITDQMEKSGVEFTYV